MKPVLMPLTYYGHTQPSGISRIAVLRFENATNHARLESMVRKSLVSAMRNGFANNVVDVGDQVQQTCQMDAVLQNGYPLSLLVETWQTFHADAVMFARIEEFRPYSPMSIGMTIHIVDTRDAKLLASLNHEWTLTDPVTRKDYELYLSRRFPDCQDLNIYMSSPTVFIEFLMQRVTERFAAG